MAQYGLPPTSQQRFGSQPHANAQNAFANSREIHANFVPYQATADGSPPSGPQDARGLEGADVFGPSPPPRNDA